MPSQSGPLETTDAELRDLAEALQHTRDPLWRQIYHQRADRALDRRLLLTTRTAERG